MNAKNTICIPIELSQFLTLTDFLREEKSEFDPVEAIEISIHYWMENASWKEDLLQREVPRKIDKGYRWKNIFMPNGTSLRMKYKGEHHYASVHGDKIIFEGEEVSPSEFANSVTGTSRNAWRDIWIKRPNDPEWVFADELRRSK